MREPRVLELRIHGVANAPPAETLCTTTERIERKDGDEQGSFWRIRPAEGAGEYAARPPLPADGLDVEAYSWGNQARSGGSALALIGRAVVHVSWLLVLPFGLCNLAYWARRDIFGEDEQRRIWEGGDGASAIRVFAFLQTVFYVIGLLVVSVHLMALECFSRAPDGQVQVCAALPEFMDGVAQWSPVARSALFGLVPVLVLVLVYLVGRRARGSFDPVRSFDRPALAGSRARTTAPDEAAPDAAGSAPAAPPTDASQEGPRTDGEEQPSPHPGEAPPRPPLLSSAAFWQGARVAQLSERTHLAGAIAFVLLVLATDAAVRTSGASSVADLATRTDLVGRAVIPLVGMIAAGILTVGAIALVIAGGLTGGRVDLEVKRALSSALLAVSSAAYVLWVVWASLDQPEDAADAHSGLIGVVVIPTAVAAVGALIAVVSLSWGFSATPRWRATRLVAAALVLAALVATAWDAMTWGDAAADGATAQPVPGPVSWIALGLVALAVLAGYLPLLLDRGQRDRARLLGWHGNGTAVMLLTAWFASLVLTSLLVLGAHAWLTTDADEPVTAGIWRFVSGASVSMPAAIEAPAFFARFAAMLVVILVLLILVVGTGVAIAMRRYPVFSVPELRFPRDAPSWATQRDAILGGTTRLVPGYPATVRPELGRRRTVAQARRVAGLAHRGEPVLTVLAILTTAALVVLGIRGFGEALSGTPAWSALTAMSGWALGLTALAAVGWVVTNAVTSTERPLGVVWDIVCFFPRAGHPFSPPCYAERAVPEVKKRVIRFIDDEYAAGRDPGVILSAHSMGGTIAVAAIFALAEADENEEPSPAGMRTDRVALLTHGVQLRAYFGRFFPEVFGWRVLGVRGTTGPSLFRSDPWSRQAREEFARPDRPLAPASDPRSLVDRLGGRLGDGAEGDGDGADRSSPKQTGPVAPRWRNLWRRTDYLGFPVYSYWSRVDPTWKNPIDRGATERSPSSYLWAVATHSDYVSTLQYTGARDELVDLLVDRGAAPPDGPAPP